MKVIQINNSVRMGGGADKAVELIRSVMEGNGITVFPLFRSSKTIGTGFNDRLRAFMDGLSAKKHYGLMKDLIASEKPDIVLIHKLFPLFSPSILSACSDTNVPVVMVCHDYRLICPTGEQMEGDNTCFVCTGRSKVWCVIKNCRDNVLESASFSLWSEIARVKGYYRKNVTRFISWSESFKSRLILDGYDEDTIAVIPRPVEIPAQPRKPESGEYAGFAGRFSREKGIETLFEAAESLPYIPFRLAGDGPLKSSLESIAPGNVAFDDYLEGERLDRFYRKSRLFCVPSIVVETFGAVAAEAMSYGIPVIASRRGGLAEIVDHGMNGYLFEPGSSGELAEQIQTVWNDAVLLENMGRAARKKASETYNLASFTDSLLEILENSVKLIRK